MKYVTSSLTDFKTSPTLDRIAAYYSPQQWRSIWWKLPVSFAAVHVWFQFIFWLSDLHSAGAF